MSATRPRCHARYRAVMRVATPADVPEVRSVLARGFVDDPLLLWMLRGVEPRLEALAAWIGCHTEQYLTAPGPAGQRSRVTIDGDRVTGAALWRWPDDDVPVPDTLPTGGGLLAALVGAEHVAQIGTAFAEVRATRPQAPHAYLHYLAVDTDRRGRGDGRRLVDDGLARAADDGLPTLLETTNPGNVPLYEHLGFTVIHAAPLGDGPTLWTMTHP